jgi:hypothetical protein
VSKYDLFRRRIAPIAFGLAIVLMARQSCQKGERTHATFVLDLGAARSQARAVDVELWTGSDMVAELHRHALDGSTIGTPRFDAVLPGSSDGELRIDVDLPAGPRHVVRRVHADEGATVTVPLGDALK